MFPLPLRTALERALMIADVLTWAQAAGDGAAQGGPPGWYTMLPFLAIAGIFLFMMTRSMRRQERDRQAMVGSLEKNDKVLTAGGIYGTVISVNPTEDEVVVKVDDNTRLRMSKASITRNVTKEEAAKNPAGKA